MKTVKNIIFAVVGNSNLEYHQLFYFHRFVSGLQFLRGLKLRYSFLSFISFYLKEKNNFLLSNFSND